MQTFATLQVEDFKWMLMQCFACKLAGVVVSILLTADLVRTNAESVQGRDKAGVNKKTDQLLSKIFRSASSVEEWKRSKPYIQALKAVSTIRAKETLSRENGDRLDHAYPKMANEALSHALHVADKGYDNFGLTNPCSRMCMVKRDTGEGNSMARRLVFATFVAQMLPVYLSSIYPLRADQLI